MPEQPAHSLADALRKSYPPGTGRALDAALSHLDTLPLPGSERWKYSPVNRLYETLLEPVSGTLANQRLTGDELMSALLDVVDCERYPLAAAAGLALSRHTHLNLQNDDSADLQLTNGGCEWLHIDVAENATASINMRLPQSHPEHGTARLLSINLGAGAHLDHTLVGNSESGTSWHLISVNQQSGSAYQLHQLSLGGTLERVETHIRLVGRNAQAHLSGTLLCGESDRCDHQVVLEHAAADCTSTARYHGLADQQGKLTFGGRIHILEDGAGTNAALQNPNLMLADTAEINTKPELEIYNDDVACAHGATVGQLDADALFYLRSRGISQAAAQALLLGGFAQASLTGPQAEELGNIAAERLQQWTRDNAATTQKPQAVLDALTSYYSEDNANVHRAAHKLAGRATASYEGARESLRRFINAESHEEIILTAGTTESINLVAQAWGSANVNAGDEILITVMEHHSNIVPWQLLAQRTGAKLIACNVTPAGEIDMADMARKVSDRTAIVAVGHVSNALGTINPVADIVELAHAHNALALIDGAQAVGHMAVDVRALDADFYAFSGHKMFGPTGVGVLYGKHALLSAMPPWQGGGEMIETVSIETTTYNKLPYKFEAGTPNIAGTIALGAAVEWLEGIDRVGLQAHEDKLLRLATSAIAQLPGVQIAGTSANKCGVLSFNVDGAHPGDIGTLLDQQDVAVRVGHHCAMPLMQHLEIPGTVRASFGLYNDTDDLDRFVAALTKALSFI